MPWLVDGDNLLGTWPGRRRTERERRALAQQLGRLAVREGRRVVVVFDGPTPPGPAFGPEVHFAAPASADQRILAWLEREADPRGWTVVTSDRSLADRCRHRQARVERSDAFRKRLAPGGEAEKPEREADVSYWLEQFED
ncbi:MAG TPA: NYN domain-containing protein [Candidatus Polarisedimenticolaceae bacterium]|nr:NYN domain-containing protein [Candidatus Polarisedimenticolaceae bacterium]